MCGIAGFIGFNNNIKLAEQANSIQKHRGPDHQAIWYDNHLAFSHQRLAIVDLSPRSNQPFVKNNLVIIFNGEIYNFKELKGILVKRYGISFQTESDTEVLLELFHHYQEKCLNLIKGMFAFAVYNQQTNEVFLARDHFGIKPLFYTRTPSGFAFASELKTLVQVPGFCKKINYQSLVNCINYLWVPGNETMFQGCHKLPPAHYMYINKETTLSLNRYWDLNDTTQESCENTHVQELREVLERTMDRHMVADVPISSFLSGGLDSSLLSVMAKNRNNKLSTYTIGTDTKDKKIEGMPADEKYAKQLVKLFEFDHNEIIIKSDIVNQLPYMVGTLDEPIGDPAALNTYLISTAAKINGVKVLLSGMGADEIFFGYRRQKANMVARTYKKAPRILRMFVESVVDKMPVVICGKGLKLVRWAKKFISFASLPASEAYRMSYSYYNADELLTLFDNGNGNEINRLTSDHKALFDSKYKYDPINQMCHTDINYFMVGLNLTYTDRASMAASVEVRVPFVDKDVIEVAMKIPGTYKYKKNESKYILKKAAEKYLPKSIIYRPKASFGAPIRSWIANDLKDMVDDLLSVEQIKKRGIFNADYIQKLIQRDRDGLEDNAYRIYQLLTVEIWFQSFVDT